MDSVDFLHSNSDEVPACNSWEFCVLTVALSRSFVFVNCASISAFISDPEFNVLFYIPEGNSPLDHCLTTVS